jgi:hypothetical protein
MKIVTAAVATLLVAFLTIFAVPARDTDIAVFAFAAIAMLATAGGVFALAARSRNQLH